MREDPTMPPDEDTEDGVLAQSAGSIRHKFKQAAFRHLKVRLATELSDRPSNCAHHSVRYMPSGTLAGLCRCSEMSDDDWPGVCDDRLTPEQPEKCGHFVSSRTKDEIKDDFREFIATAQLYEIASKYPDLAPLLWVLGDDAPGRELEVGDWDPGDEVRIEIYDHVLTADDAETAEAVVEILSDIERRAEGLRQQVVWLERDLAETEEARDAERKRAEELQERVDALIAENGKLVAQTESLRDECKKRGLTIQPPVPSGVRGVIWRWLTRTES
jgi:hypothetical protein